MAIMRELLASINEIGSAVPVLGPGDDPLSFIARAETAALRCA